MSKASVIYDKFDLDLPKGEFISIFGPNGCGKSTLINLISGLMPMDARNFWCSALAF